MKPFSVAVRSVVSLLLLACVPVANAASQNISAIFRPDASKPNLNQFTNTTPVSGYCTFYPADCAATKIFSIQLPISFNSNSPIQANHTDYRQGATFKVPANWRTAQVTHAETGEIETVEVRFSGIGSRYRLPMNVLDLIGNPNIDLALAHNRLWGGYGHSWVNPGTPCGYTGHGGLNATTYRFFWKTRVEAACSKKASFLIPSFTYDYLDFAYELRTPNPLKMSSGLYTGSLTYNIGPGQDLDMGDVMIPSDPVLTFNFNLTVEHTLKIEVPPGGNRVELVPQDGWQAWLNSGRKPTRLFRDQRFHISASSRFKMALECQQISGNTCAISEAGTGHAVPVDVSVTLPDGLTDAGGQPVNRRRLLRDGSGTELFQPGLYVDRRPGMLHFEVARSSVEEMLDSGAKAYTGNVTVIWDSEV
ncbi:MULTISPECIES: hypothetical protein [unclassified Pseudomonas]|uniref:hypothetical protein n=1 Tax=unclassified Pseudomonas TaxID=196821 RepID=UPI00119C5E11|nr:MULTISPECIES: hypothetical protein [unclassified Pseudomonas]TWC20390.1 hypothetical protein FBY00_10415 [Pseudomonas sp. SJZ075]TWC25731.1 hypothetical protein FBX99_101270 [Pseudomonas sp. SJZ074]TWC35820.1 hypothetical protein FBY02_10416 [Pseudomonas sp. SJZ078]TWC42542.1 hypothetical protein FBY06_101270 [Pseudomonas sp. SJZ085]TWC56688.1 hypothetical protein FBY11_10415 [Pseudomonas sp. SJZ124]